MKKILLALACVLAGAINVAEAGKNDAAIQYGVEQMRQIFKDNSNSETANALVDGAADGYAQGMRANQCISQCREEMRGRLRPGQSRSCQDDRGCSACARQCTSNSQ